MMYTNIVTLYNITYYKIICCSRQGLQQNMDHLSRTKGGNGGAPSPDSATVDVVRTV